MVKCPNCQAEHPENTLFCDKCGAYLLGGNQTETDTVVVGEVIWMEREETGEASEVDAPPPWASS